MSMVCTGLSEFFSEGGLVGNLSNTLMKPSKKIIEKPIYIDTEKKWCSRTGSHGI